MESGNRQRTGGQGVFERLYSEARTRVVKRPISASQVDDYQGNFRDLKPANDQSKQKLSHNLSASALKRPSEALISPSQSSAPSASILHCYVNLSLPQSQEPQVRAKPVPTLLQATRVVVTAPVASQRLQLKPVHPEIPEGGTTLSYYDRLLRAGQGRKGTEVILTQHYAQLTPVVSAYSFKAGCHLAEWVKRSKPSLPPNTLQPPR